MLEQQENAVTLKVTGVCGSLRRNSWNRRLLEAAAIRMPEGSELQIGTIDDIPLYNFDVEKGSGFPQAVVVLSEQIAHSDGLLIATPEYNNSMPGVLKNAIDWLSRPVNGDSHVLRNKPVALMGATPGGFGTQLAQVAWLPVMRTLGTQLWTGGRMPLSNAPSLFDADGQLNDDTTDQRLRRFLQDYMDFLRSTT